MDRRSAICEVYGYNKVWVERVSNMSDEQVLAIYLKFLKCRKLKYHNKHTG